MEKEAKQKVNWLPVILYYVIACAVSWPFFWWRDINPESWQLWNVPQYVKTWSYMWGPGIAAIICMFLFRKTHIRTITLFGSSIGKSVMFFIVPILLLTIPGMDGQNMNPHLYPLVLVLLPWLRIWEKNWAGGDFCRMRSGRFLLLKDIS